MYINFPLKVNWLSLYITHFNLNISRIRSPLIFLLCSLVVRAVMGSHWSNVLLSPRGSPLRIKNLRVVQHIRSTSHMWHPLKRKHVKVIQPPALAVQQIQKPPRANLSRTFPFVGFATGMLLYTVIMQIGEGRRG